MTTKEDVKKVVQLSYAVPLKKSDGSVEMLESLTMGRIKLKHIKLIPSSVFEQSGKEGQLEISPQVLIPMLPALVAGLAGIPEETAGEVDLDDLGELMETLQDFFASIQATDGNTPSG